MTSKILPLLAGTMLSTQAFALDVCKVSALDPQHRICTYSPEQRYVVSGVVGFIVGIQFGPDERIKLAEFAYTGVDKDGRPTASWRGPPTRESKDQAAAITEGRYQTYLPIWPFAEGVSGMQVVTTLQDGSERPYSFVLMSRKPASAEECAKDITKPGCPGDVTTTNSMAFDYPVDKAAAAAKAAAEKKAAAVAAWQAQQKTKNETDAVARLKQDVFYGQRNWAYQFRAEKQWAALQPSEVSDNGWLTEMRWPENVQIPAITILDPVTKEERTAPSSQQGHLVIIATTAQRFRLRIGKEAVADVINERWSAERPNPETGTTSPDVARHVIYADGKPQ